MVGYLGRLGGRMRMPWSSVRGYLNPDQLSLHTLIRIYTTRSTIYTLKGFCLVSCFNEYVFEIRPSTGPSMLPTLNTSHDALLSIRLGFNRLLQMNWKDFFQHASITRTIGVKGKSASMGTGIGVGDLVTVVSPRNPGIEACKRVLGLPGDTILVDTRMDPPLYHDLEWSHQNESKSKKENIGIDLHKKPIYIVIPKGHIWLGGDNMANSTDSRHYGPVPLGLVRGKVVARVTPSFTWLPNALQPAPQ